MRFVTAFLLFLMPLTLCAKTLKEPSDPNSTGNFSVCMKKEDYRKCRNVSLAKMKEYASALEQVRIHNKTILSASSAKVKPLKVNELSEKFDKWYTRYVVLSTSPFYKGKL